MTRRRRPRNGVVINTLKTHVKERWDVTRQHWPARKSGERPARHTREAPLRVASLSERAVNERFGHDWQYKEVSLSRDINAVCDNTTKLRYVKVITT